MKIKHLLLYFSFFVLETVVAFILLLFWESVTKPSITFGNQIFEASIVILINLWRLLFYLIPLIIVFLASHKYFNRIKLNKSIVYAIFNVSVFIGLNFFYKFYKNLPTLDFIESLFWITIASIFISPIILGQFPYFRKLMNT